ncbi:MAG: hypothetical protein J5699_04165 [Bacteroidales bacterium]|nr:hypothetical protein [Bacteroidales bacterium]
MGIINDSFMLKRDETAEKAAVDGILSLFAENWDDTSKKTSREIISLVLMQIKDACIVVPKGESSQESMMLIRVKQYLEQLIEQLQSGEPLQVVLSGNTFEDTINNLKRIKSSIKDVEYASDIRGRLNYFIERLNQASNQLIIENNKRQRKVVLFSILLGLGFASLIEFGEVDDYYRFNLLNFLIMVFLGFVGAFTILSKVIKK